MDPVVKKHQSPYIVFDDNPTLLTDVNGDQTDTTRAYSNKTGEYLGTTYGGTGNKALVVDEKNVDMVRSLLKNSDQNKGNVALQNDLETKLDKGFLGVYPYGTLYDVSSMFKFYDDHKLLPATQFESNGKHVNFSDLQSGALNGKKINPKTFKPLGAEVEGNLVYKNGIITMGNPAKFRTALALNFQNRPVPTEPNFASKIHIHPGLNFSFKYRLKNNKTQYELNIIPNLRPSGDPSKIFSGDYSLANSNQQPRLVVVSSDRLYLYSNNAYEEITIDRKIK